MRQVKPTEGDGVLFTKGSRATVESFAELLARNSTQISEE